MRLLTRFAVLAAAVAAIGVFGVPAANAKEDCGDLTVAAGGGDGRVRVVHMSPDAPAVDVLVNGRPAITNLAFKEASAYASLPGGTYDVAVTPAGQNNTVVLAAPLPVTAGQDVTVVAVGRLAEIGVLALIDDNTAPAAGNAKVRFVHASPDAPAVDIAVAGGPVLFPNVAFKESAGYAQVPAGTYDLEVRVAGTDTVALSLPGVTLTDGLIATVFAAGLLADGSLTAVPVAYSGS
jgi:hypothetical protein